MKTTEIRRVYKVTGKYTLGSDEADWISQNPITWEELTGTVKTYDIPFETRVAVAWNQDAQTAVNRVKRFQETPGTVTKRGEEFKQFTDKRSVQVESCKFITEFSEIPSR